MARARFGLILAVALWLATPLGHAGIALPLSQPSWSELSPAQKRILAPLSGDWDKMEGFRRKKWLGIAQRYPSLTPDEQARMQRRMTDWAKLTPDERKRARDKYKALQKDPPEKKEAVKAKWQEYKDLPENEKARLNAEAARKPTPRPAPSKTVVVPKTAPAPVAPPSATPADQATVR
ncbi:MAG: DUF3106 domain-containing protein [Rhodocyclales bacterium]|jgi:hypothetical protein|nr:DUF3106 domain-containing protein [Rhodocyclales bacterium]